MTTSPTRWLRASVLAAAGLVGAAPAACAVQDPPAVEPREAPAEAPQDPDANALRAMAFAAEKRGDHTAAADAFLKLVELEPTEPEWVLRAADDLGKAGRFNDATDVLDAGRKRFPDVLSLSVMLAKTWHLVADSSRANGVVDANVIFHYQDAARLAEEILAVDAEQFEARLIAASAHYETGDYDRALGHAEEAVARSPAAYGGHAMIGRICLQRYVEARQQIDAAELGAAQRETLREAIDALSARATTAFRAAAAAEPDRAFPHTKLGDLAAWRGDLDGALEAYGTALSIDPATTLDHGWLRTAVDAERRRSFYAAALASYRARADATDARAATLTWYVAQSAFDQAANLPADAPPARRSTAWREAGDLFASTRDALPEYTDTFWWLFQARYWSGDLPAATQVSVEFATAAPRRFADMIRGDEQTVAAVTGLAATSFEAGRLADSRDLNRVLAYARQTADAWNNYAFRCRETRQYDESLRAYEEALRIEPDSPQLMNDAGVILQYHLKSGDAEQRARALYEQAIVAAERQIAEGQLSGDALQRTRIALRDARANLAALRSRRGD